MRFNSLSLFSSYLPLAYIIQTVCVFWSGNVVRFQLFRIFPSVSTILFIDCGILFPPLPTDRASCFVYLKSKVFSVLPAICYSYENILFRSIITRIMCGLIGNCELDPEDNKAWFFTSRSISYQISYLLILESILINYSTSSFSYMLIVQSFLE